MTDEQFQHSKLMRLIFFSAAHVNAEHAIRKPDLGPRFERILTQMTFCGYRWDVWLP